MKVNIENIIDDNGFKLLVKYYYEQELGYFEEKDNISSYVPSSVYTEIKEAALYFNDEGVIIPIKSLSEKQKEFIISKLTYL